MQQNDSLAVGYYELVLNIGQVVLVVPQVIRGLTAAIPMDNPYCSCALTRVRPQSRATRLPPSFVILSDTAAVPILCTVG